MINVKKIIFFSILFVISIAIFSCTRNIEKRLQNDMDDTMEELIDHGTVYVLNYVSLSSGNIHYVDAVHYIIGFNPYFYYGQFGAPHMLVFLDDNGKYYGCDTSAGSPNKDVYILQEYSENSLDRLNIPTFEDVTDTTAIELPNLTKELGSYIATMTFNQLISNEIFESYDNMLEGLSQNEKDIILGTKVKMEFSFDNGILIETTFDFELSNNQFEFYSKIQLTETDVTFDVMNRDQFLIIDNDEITNPKHIEVDETIHFPDYPSGYDELLYYEIDLEIGHYYFDTSLSNFTINFYEDLSGNSLNLYEIGNSFFPIKSINVLEAGTYYLYINAAEFKSKDFTITKMDYEDYGSETNMDLSQSASLDYVIEGKGDVISLRGSYESPYSLIISGIDESISVYHSDSFEEIEPFYVNNEAYYMLNIENENNTIYLLGSSEIEVNGTITHTISPYNMTMREENMVQLTSTFTNPLLADSATHYLGITINEAGYYDIQAEMPYENGNVVARLFNSTNPDYLTYIDGYEFDGTNMTMTVYLEVGFYVLSYTDNNESVVCFKINV